MISPKRQYLSNTMDACCIICSSALVVIFAICVPTASLAQTNFEPLYSRGLVEYNLAKYKQAVKWLEEALKVKPDDFHSLYYLGASYFETKRYGSAYRAFEKATSINPRNAESMYCLGLSQLELGMYRQAIESLEKAAKLDPSFEPAAHFYSGIAYARLGERDKAERRLMLAMEHEGVSPELYAASQEAMGNLARMPEKRWAFSTSARYEYDSNVALIPEDKSIVDISGEDDFRFMTTADLLLRPVVKEKFELSTEYFFNQSVHNQMGDFNLQGHNLLNTLLFKPGKIHPFAGYEYDYYFLDDNRESFLRTHALFTGFNLFASDTGITQFNYRYSVDDFFHTPTSLLLDRDDHNNSFGFDQYVFFGRAKGDFFRFGFYYDRNSAQGDTYFYDGYRFIWELYKKLIAEVTLDASAEYYLREFTRDSLRHRDNRQTYNFALTRNLNEYLEVGFNYNLIINDSGDPFFTFDRDIFTLFCAASF